MRASFLQTVDWLTANYCGRIQEIDVDEYALDGREMRLVERQALRLEMERETGKEPSLRMMNSALHYCCESGVI